MALGALRGLGKIELEKKPWNNDPLGPLGPFQSPDQFCKKFWSPEKCQFWSNDQFCKTFELMKNGNFNLMKFDLMIIPHLNNFFKHDLD
jgi:hypothetical protein